MKMKLLTCEQRIEYVKNVLRMVSPGFAHYEMMQELFPNLRNSPKPEENRIEEAHPAREKHPGLLYGYQLEDAMLIYAAERFKDKGGQK